MKKVLIIAEAGVNHNGSLTLAKKLVDEACKAGADIIKFQTFIAENLASKRAEKAEYQKQQTGTSESQLEMLKKLELTFDEFVQLNDYCRRKGIEFLSTAFDLDSLAFLNSLGM
ncbi:MAG: N-acetylneuraminate synthase family protein, partial [Bacillota bacterium]|nr:N-acetylneuraminate synthase family protein [Bacillota bacterium]